MVASVNHTTTLESSHRSAAMHFVDDNLLVAIGIDANISVWKIGEEDGATLADSASSSPPSSAGHYMVTATAVCDRDWKCDLIDYHSS